MPTARSITVGFTGKRDKDCWVVRSQSTFHMCSKGTLGCPRPNIFAKDASEPQTCYTHRIASLHLIERTCHHVSRFGSGPIVSTAGRCPNRHANRSNIAQRYLERCGMRVEDLFYHVLAVLHDPTYREENAGALRMEWPRIPLPGWPKQHASNIASTLSRSAARGRELALLLDADTPVPGVTQGALRPELSEIAVPTVTDGRNMTSGRLRGDHRLGSLRSPWCRDAGPGAY